MPKLPGVSHKRAVNAFIKVYPSSDIALRAHCYKSLS
jgi:hypothetical protein